MNGAKYKPVTAELKWCSQWISTCPALQSHHNQHQSDLKNIKVKEKEITLARLYDLILCTLVTKKIPKPIVTWFTRAFSHLARVTCFPALGTGYMLSRVCKDQLFSRATHRLHSFPPFTLVAPRVLSRAWHRSHDLASSSDWPQVRLLSLRFYDSHNKHSSIQNRSLYLEVKRVTLEAHLCHLLLLGLLCLSTNRAPEKETRKNYQCFLVALIP